MSNEISVVRYRSDEGVFTALLVNRGRKHLSLVPMTAYGDTGMRVVKLPLCEERKLAQVYYHDREYPVNRALRLFRKAYRKFGGTKAVKQALYA
jgi:hypothetical protein